MYAEQNFKRCARITFKATCYEHKHPSWKEVTIFDGMNVAEEQILEEMEALLHSFFGDEIVIESFKLIVGKA